MSSTLKLGYKIFVKSIDKGVLEFLGPLGLSFFFKTLSLRISTFQTGLLYHYAFVFLVGLMLLLILFAFNLSWVYFLEPGLLMILTFSIFVLIISN